MEFMHVHQAFTAEQIRDHSSMRKPDGFKHRLDVIKRWINRFDATGTMETKPKTGRPPKVLSNEAHELINLIKQQPKKRYPEVKRMSRLGVSVRTVNRIANKFGIRKCPFQ